MERMRGVGKGGKRQEMRRHGLTRASSHHAAQLDLHFYHRFSSGKGRHRSVRASHRPHPGRQYEERDSFHAERTCVATQSEGSHAQGSIQSSTFNFLIRVKARSFVTRMAPTAKA